MPIPVKIPVKAIPCSDCTHSEKFTLNNGIRKSTLQYLLDRYICMYDKNEEVLIGPFSSASEKTCQFAQQKIKNQYVNENIMLFNMTDDPREEVLMKMI